MYEYGVMARYRDGLHRGPMTKTEAEDWVQEWEDEIGPGQEAMSGLFWVVKREVGEWEDA